MLIVQTCWLMIPTCKMLYDLSAQVVLIIIIEFSLHKLIVCLWVVLYQHVDNIHVHSQRMHNIHVHTQHVHNIHVHNQQLSYLQIQDFVAESEHGW